MFLLCATEYGKEIMFADHYETTWGRMLRYEITAV